MNCVLNNGTLPGSDINVDEAARCYSDLLKVPSPAKAHFEHEDENVLSISSEWTYSDVIKKEKSTLVKNYTVLKSSLTGNTGNSLPTTYEFTPINENNVKLTCYSNSGTRKAVVTNNTSDEKGSKKKQFLEVYCAGVLNRTFNLKDIDKHQGIYTSNSWGNTMAWSPDETKLAYMAEKKIPKPKPFLSSAVVGTETSDEDDTRGEEYAFRQSWGEQLRDDFEAVIVILDLETEIFSLLPLPDKIFPSDLQWSNNSTIIGTGYCHTDWRLGLIYCSNRESRIFQVNIDGTGFCYLSNASTAARSPRVRPDGNLVIWQERRVEGPHQKSRQIVGMQSGVCNILYEHNPSTLVPVYEDFPQSCWTPDGSKFVTVTSNEVEHVLLIFTVGIDGRIIGSPQIIRDIYSVLCIGKEYILASRNSQLQTPYLVLLNWKIPTGKPAQISRSERVILYPVHRLLIPGSVSPASFYYGPSDDEVKPNSVPLIVMPHGGPHSLFVDEFIPELAFFLQLGYGVLRLNYVGSLGGTRDATEDLLGKVGQADLQDCQNTVRSLLSQEKSVDPARIVIHGGSHGGFLGAHLSSSFPETYKAVVLRNPVVDILANTSASDITDWQYEEVGLKRDGKTYLPFVKDLESAAKLMKCSPIHHAVKVQAATLLLLGSEDVRVPMSQGMAYYRALIDARKTAEIRLYDDCHPLMKVPCRFDAGMHSVLWFAKHLKATAE